jgi:hypothetical protein
MATVYLIESLTETQRLTKQGCLSILIQAMALIMANNGKAMTLEQQEIQSLKKQLWRAKRDNRNPKKGNSLVRYGLLDHYIDHYIMS